MEEACHSCHGWRFSWGMWLMRDYTFKYAVALNAAVNLWNITQNTQYNKRNKPFLREKKNEKKYPYSVSIIAAAAAVDAGAADNNIRTHITQCVYFNGFCCISFGIVKGDTQLWETNYYIESKRGFSILLSSTLALHLKSSHTSRITFQSGSTYSAKTKFLFLLIRLRLLLLEFLAVHNRTRCGKQRRAARASGKRSDI